MSSDILYPLQTLFAFFLFATIAAWWVAPALRRLPYHTALSGLLLLSAFRYLGLNFATPDPVAQFPASFVGFAPFGDLVCALIAIAGAFALRFRLRLGIPLAWAYAVLGTADFAIASYLANTAEQPVFAGTSWPIFLLGGPFFIVSLALVFRFLMKPTRRTLP